MRNLLPAALLFALIGCQNKAPSGPGVVKITETTTTTTTIATTTVPLATDADFQFSPLTPEELQPVNFDGSLSKPGTDRTIVSYSWDFGDGDPPKTGVRVTHDFVKTGVYLVTLTVTDDSGKTDRESKPVTVRPKAPTTTTTI
jgi:PKD repeat protein